MIADSESPATSGITELDGFLQKIDLRLKRQNDRMMTNLVAWVGVLDALGWNVALFLPKQAPLLGTKARQWAVENLDGCANQGALLAHLAARPPVRHLVNSPQLQVWKEAVSDSPAEAAEQIPRAPLTRRENEVLAWLREGKTGPEIAVILGCSQRTVESHVARIYRKFGVHHRSQLHFSFSSADH